MVFYPMLVTIPKELSANFASVKIAPPKTELASKEFASICAHFLRSVSMLLLALNLFEICFKFVSDLLQIPLEILLNRRC